MDVSRWAEIHRLKKVEGLTNKAIADRLGCCTKTVSKALKMEEPPSKAPPLSRSSQLDPFKKQVKLILDRYPDLSVIRIHEKLQAKGYEGSMEVVRKYVKKIRPQPQGRVYLEANFDPGEAFQVDWGCCGRIEIGDSRRKLYVFVAVLCYSRMMYLEFSLSQKKEDFYHGIVSALRFFGGVPQRIILDNLKAAVLEGSGKNAQFHPEFMALCGHYLLEPIACAARDPESKGRVEASIKYIKSNALAGYEEELKNFSGYQRHSHFWRDQVANVRLHGTTRKRPIDLFEEERPLLRDLPPVDFDTDVTLPVIANSLARVNFDANRYSVPPLLARKPLTLKASKTLVRLLEGSEEVARHPRSYEQGQLLVLAEHKEQALKLRQKEHLKEIEIRFDALGVVAQEFRQQLLKRPLRSSVHLRRILKFADLYGTTSVLQALSRALELRAIDSAYVENLIHQERRKANLPSPTELRPAKKELLETTLFEVPDPAEYDKLFDLD